MPTLSRWTVDTVAGRVDEEQLDDRTGEFPRIDDPWRGAGRNGHVTSSGRAADAQHGGSPATTCARRGRRLRPRSAPGARGGGLHARADGTPDGAGLSVVYEPATDTSDLVILDADRLAGPPVAAIRLPARVPFGFHGSWLSATS